MPVFSQSRVLAAALLCAMLPFGTAEQEPEPGLKLLKVASETQRASSSESVLARRRTATTAETMEDAFAKAKGQAIQSGGTIYLRSLSGRLLNVDSEGTLSLSHSTLGQAGMVIHKAGSGAMRSGDSIFLQAGGNLLALDGTSVKADDSSPGPMHQWIIEKAGGGEIHSSDAVVLRLANGGTLRTIDDRVLATKTVKAQPFILEQLPYGSLHDVVGHDGVLMITLKRKSSKRRDSYSLNALGAANVYPIEFAATDAADAPKTQLDMTCPLESDEGASNWCNDMGRSGAPGCKSTIEQAITDSHRRALVRALNRQGPSSNWTAIIEDDVVPLMPEQFDDAFREAWAQLPKEAKLVRLGWCTFENDLGTIRDEAIHEGEHGSRLVRKRWWTDRGGNKHYYTGGCTTGYMVHRSMIPEMLGIFPCCCPIDCCLERQLFYSPAQKVGESEWEKWRGHEIMVDMDLVNSKVRSAGYATFAQSGILAQDNRKIKSERPEWGQTA